MPNIKKKSNAFFYFKLAVALIFLINPCIKTFDLLPDFVSAIIAAGLIKELCERAPGFSEAKEEFVRLGWVSFIRLPAMLLVIVIRSKDTSDNDIITLFCFVFAVFEGYLLFAGVRRLFDALFHIGMRGADAAINPFPVLGKRVSLKPEALRIMCFAFAAVRGLCYALPEMVLLATSDKISDPDKIFNAWALYPKAVSAGALITVIFGALVAILFFLYIRAIKKEGALTDTVNSLYGEAEKQEIEEKIHIKSLKFRLKILAASSFLALRIVFDGTEGIDVLPGFIYGIALFVSVSLLFKKSNTKKLAQIFCGFYTLFSLVCYLFTTDFLSVYKYSSLVNKAAKDAFIPVLISAGAEAVFLIICMVLLGMLLCGFEGAHTGSENLSRLSVENKRAARTKAIIYSSLGALHALAEFLCYVFEFFQTASEVEINGYKRIITTSLLPWFDSVSFVITLAFIAYSCYYLSSLSSDIELKYS